MLADGEYVEYNEYNENYMVMMANIEDLPLITRCVTSYMCVCAKPFQLILNLVNIYIW